VSTTTEQELSYEENEDEDEDDQVWETEGQSGEYKRNETCECFLKSNLYYYRSRVTHKEHREQARVPKIRMQVRRWHSALL
jgi:hypothetical protein